MTRRRIVLAKVGLDGHDVGIRLLAKRLSEAGFEVVYLGKRNLPELIVKTAIDEDVDAIGVSSLSGGLREFTLEILDLLADEQADIPVITGGLAEPQDLDGMHRAGIAAHFGPGDDMNSVIAAFTR